MAHFPSGIFTTNVTWLVPATIAFNLSRPAANGHFLATSPTAQSTEHKAQSTKHTEDHRQKAARTAAHSGSKSQITPK